MNVDDLQPEKNFHWLKKIIAESKYNRNKTLPALVAFVISFILFGLVYSYVLKLNPPAISPLALTSTPRSSTEILGISINSPATSPRASSTDSPTPKPTLTPTPRPTPTPKPIASPVTLTQLEDWFTQYANKESINRDLLRKIANCESKFNPEATNGIYGGLYQFSTSTWISTRQAMNLNSDANLRFNAEEAIKTGAFRIATTGDAAWPNCRK